MLLESFRTSITDRGLHALRAMLQKKVTVPQFNAQGIALLTRSQTPGVAQWTHPWQDCITKTSFTKQRNQIYSCECRINKPTSSIRERQAANYQACSKSMIVGQSSSLTGIAASSIPIGKPRGQPRAKPNRLNHFVVKLVL